MINIRNSLLIKYSCKDQFYQMNQMKSELDIFIQKIEHNNRKQVELQNMKWMLDHNNNKKIG